MLTWDRSWRALKTLTWRRTISLPWCTTSCARSISYTLPTSCTATSSQVTFWSIANAYQLFATSASQEPVFNPRSNPKYQRSTSRQRLEERASPRCLSPSVIADRRDAVDCQITSCLAGTVHQRSSWWKRSMTPRSTCGASAASLLSYSPVSRTRYRRKGSLKCSSQAIVAIRSPPGVAEQPNRIRGIRIKSTR